MNFIMKHFVFRKNHIDGYLMITSAFNRKDNKGLTVVEHVQPQTHFVPRGTTDKKVTTTEKEMVEYHNYVYDKWLVQYNKLDEKMELSEFDTDFSLLLTFIKQNNIEPKKVTYQLPSVQSIFQRIDTDQRLSEMIIGSQLQPHLPESWNVVIGEPYSVFIDIGNDPTPDMANSVISLGYSNVRIEMRCCTLTNKQPITLIGPEIVDIMDNEVIKTDKNIVNSINRPLRRPSCIR